MNNKDLALKPIEKYGGDVLPRHSKAHEKHHLETTYHKDYVNHNPHMFAQPKSEQQVIRLN